MRNESKGTVSLVSSSSRGEVKKRSGSHKCPALRACTETVWIESAAGCAFSKQYWNAQIEIANNMLICKSSSTDK